MAGKEAHKKRNDKQRARKREVNEHVDNHRKSGVLEIPDDLPFSEYVQNLHGQEARFDAGTKEYEEIGRLKYQVIAKVLGEDASGIGETASVTLPSMRVEELPENRTAYGFYRSLLNVFEPFPWEIPFSAVNTLAHQVQGEDYTATQEAIRKHGSESIITKAVTKHGKLRDLWEAYLPNRSAGINIAAYFAKNPRTPSAGLQRKLS